MVLKPLVNKWGFQLPLFPQPVSWIRRISGCHQTLGRWKHSLKPFTFYLVEWSTYKMGPPNYYISGFIPSYTHLQPWLNRVCWGYNYLITRGAPSCIAIYGNSAKSRTRAALKGCMSSKKTLEKLMGIHAPALWHGVCWIPTIINSDRNIRKKADVQEKLWGNSGDFSQAAHQFEWHGLTSQTSGDLNKFADMCDKIHQWFADAPCCQVHTHLRVSQNTQLPIERFRFYEGKPLIFWQDTLQ